MSKENTFKEFYIKAESERSKSTNPSVEEIIGGIIQLIGGNVKLNKPLNKPQLPAGLNEQDLFNHGIRLNHNNRNPSLQATNGLNLNQLPTLYHSSVLIGPPPPGMPLPLAPYNSGKVTKPPPNLLLPSNQKGSLRIPESNITSILDHKLKPQVIFDPLNRVPSNKILPKPQHHSPQLPHERDTALGSQLHPDFASPASSGSGNSVGVGGGSLVASPPRLPYHLQPFSSSSATRNTGVNSEKQHHQQQQHQVNQPLGLGEAILPLSTSTDSPSAPFLRPSLANVASPSPATDEPNTLLDHLASFSTSTQTTQVHPTVTMDQIVAPERSKDHPSSPFHESGPSKAPFSPFSVMADAAQGALDGEHVDKKSLKTNLKETERESNSNPSDPSDWLPLGQASLLKPSKTWSEAPPIIITQEDPSVFDITIRHKIGASADTSFKVTVPSISIKPTKTQTLAEASATATAATSTLPNSSPPVIASDSEHLFKSPSTAVPASSSSTMKSLSSSPSQTNKGGTTMTSLPNALSTGATTTISPTPASSSIFLISSSSSPISPTPSSDLFPVKTRKPSIYNRPKVDALDVESDDEEEQDEDVVYGKPQEANRPIAPSIPEITVMGSGVLTTQRTPVNKQTTHHYKSGHQSHASSSVSSIGKPFVIPVDVDEVKPKMGAATGTTSQIVVTDPGQGSVYIDGRPTHFKIRPVPTLQVGSGVTVKPSPNDAGSLGLGGGPSSGGGRVQPVPRPTTATTSSSSKSPSVRRPPFRLRPSVPLVRIDTCIVGDDSTCEVKMNERCKTELGISSCQCRPGFGRSTARGMCNPIITLGVALKLDKLADNKLTYTSKYANSNSEEYQFLEYETIQGFNSMFSLSRLSKVFMGVRVNKFYTAGGKLLVNASIDLELNNVTKAPAIKRIVQQELARVITLRNNNIGDSQLWVDAAANSVPRVEDVNECYNGDLNDCSPNAFCINEFGSFRCLCKKGYEDRYATDPKKAGRQCSSCSPAYCSNRGECHIVNGEKECKCRGNFIGAKCDIDVEGEYKFTHYYFHTQFTIDNNDDTSPVIGAGVNVLL